MNKSIVCGLAWLAFVASPAWSQDAGRSVPAPQPPTPEASAEADRLIAATGHAELFANVSEGEVPQVRHLKSGLECDFEMGVPENRIIIFDRDEAPGDDVGCSSRALDIDTSFYASRYPEDYTPDMAMQDAVNAIKQRFKRVRPYKGMGVSIGADDGPDWWREKQVLELEGDIDGEKLYTAVILLKHDGWTYKLRVTAPLKLGGEASMMGQLAFTALLIRLRDSPPPS